MAFITILLTIRPNARDIIEMGQKVRAVHPRLCVRPPAHHVSRTLLGGRDTFAPIRAMLLGPDMQKLVEMAQGSQRAR